MIQLSGYTSIAQLKDNPFFEGVLYYTVNTDPEETDTATVFVQKNKILSIWNGKILKRKGTTKILIVADDNTHDYRFQDKRKVILKDIPNNEFAKRNFTLSGRDTVAGFSSLKYYSSYATNDNPRKVTNTYKKAISVFPDLKFRDKDTYLVNFFVYKGNFITKIVDTFYFADSKYPYIVITKLLKIDYKRPDDKLFDLPKDYVIQPFQMNYSGSYFLSRMKMKYKKLLKKSRSVKKELIKYR